MSKNIWLALGENFTVFFAIEKIMKYYMDLFIIELLTIYLTNSVIDKNNI